MAASLLPIVGTMTRTIAHDTIEHRGHPLSGGRSSPGTLGDWPFRMFATAVLCSLYFGAARLGLSLAPLHKNVSLVWPPAGIALAALLLYGYRVWPGIALGAFFASVTTGVGPVISVGIALGNTLEAITGTYLLRRLTRFRGSLE